jgi:hypothetical protein
VKQLRATGILSFMALLTTIAAWAQTGEGTADTLPAGPPQAEAAHGSVPVPGDQLAAGESPSQVPQQTQRRVEPEDLNLTTPPVYAQPPGISALSRLGERSQHTLNRLRRVLVLRQLLTLGFTTGDIAATLPLLRSLRDISTPPPADPDQAIEEEYKALLLASPGNPLPPSSAVKITDAARYYREEQAKIWGGLGRKLGSRKAEGLRALLGQERIEVLGQIVDPDVNRLQVPTLTPGGSNPLEGATDGPARTPDTSAPLPGDVGGVPGDLAAQPIPEAPPVQLSIAKKGGESIPRSVPNPRRSASASRPTPGEQYLEGIRSARDTQRQSKFQPASVRISLTELIDLMQEKLEAMSGSRTPRTSEVERARTEVADAEENLRRTQDLFKKGIAAESKVRAARQRLADAKSHLAAQTGLGR